MRENYRFILFLLLFTNLIQGTAQVQKIGIPEVEYFNRRQYLGGTQNWDISQAKSGFMYFANNYGVLEYDGENWNMLDRLNDYVVRSVKVIGDRLYVGSFNELGFFEYDSLQNLKFTSFAGYKELLGMEDFWDIHYLNEQIVFASKKGLCFFRNDELEHVIKAPSSFVSSFVVNGLLLVQDEKMGLMEVRGNKAFPVAGGNIFRNKEVTTVFSLPNDEVVLGTMKNGLFVWDMQSIKKWEVAVNDVLIQTNIFCGQRYNKDFLVFGTIQGGIVIADVKGNVFMQIDKDKGLTNNTVLSIEVDAEGNIWGGLDNGIVRVNFNSSVTFLQGYYNLGTGYCVAKHQNQYYFGTNQALYQISEQGFLDPLKQRNDFKRIKGTEGQVWAIYSKQDQLLCGHNLGAFEIRNGRAFKLTPEEINGVWNFLPVQGNKNLMISGTYTGLCLFEKRNGRWFYKNKIKGFNESSRFLEWDKEGNLWMSHGYQGVYKLKFNQDYSEVVEFERFEKEKFPDNESRLVLTKIMDDCVFSSADGIYRLSSEANIFKRDNRFNLYFQKGNFPDRLQEDRFNNIWYFQDTGVGVLRYQEDGSYKKIEFPFLSMKNKLVNSFEYLYVQDEENTLFGVEDGFAHYSSNDIKNYQVPFNVHIRGLRERSDTISYHLNNVSNGTVSQSLIPKFNFKNNEIEVSYAASFMEGSEVWYATKLIGLDEDFLQWSELNLRTFANLHEGRYELIVKAKNRYGVEAEPLRFSFVVLPPWHRSSTAKVSYAILIILIGIFIVYLINRRVEYTKEKEKIKQQDQFKAKENQLRNAALQSEKEMVKMRNDKLRGEMVFKEKELANSTINLIQKNELLSDIKLQLKKIIQIKDHHDSDKKISSLIRKIDKDIDNENNWEVFEMHFGQVHEEFLKRLIELHPNLSQREQKLSAFIRMGMSSKEIASLMNITTRAVENNRYKLRQKLGIEHGDNLLAYISKL